ncbi:unnamed protein product [Cylindrotheca closterium]|uniref:Choline transporter-like protein n=1 Tax=Cylindrotheca closterium TaxID=2856 RepID=A0AAD2G582_9STRA|nr:unnamed protein product [Cylindrotheca closterium]
MSSQKSFDNGEPQMVPVVYATISSNQDPQDVSEAQPIPSEMIQVEDTAESDIPYQAQQQQQQPLHHGQEPLSPSTDETAGPATAIQIVTFDEQPAEGDVTDNALRQQEESTPLLQQEQQPHGHVIAAANSNTPITNNPYASGAFHDETSVGGGPECHNLFWAVLYWTHIAVVVYAGTQLAPQGYLMMEKDEFDLQQLHDFMQDRFVNDDDFTAQDLDELTHFLDEFQAWWGVYPPRIAWFSWGVAVVSFFLNLVKNIIPSRTICFVTYSLVIFGIILGLFLMILTSGMGFWGFVISAVLIGFLAVFIRKQLWPKIHFAALNLEIALTGIGKNLGTYAWVMAWAKMTIAWIAFWCYTFLGLMQYVTTTKCPHLKFDPRSDDNDILCFCCGATNVVLLALLLSLYWTLSSVAATIQVYVAGVMGTWCFDKDAAGGFCSTAVTSSIYRSLTFSSGPIAFGSLLQGVAKMLRSILSHSHRNQHRSSQLVYDSGDDCRCCCFGLCGLVLECLSELFGDVLDYFSQWAYVFVGINGTSYLESGKAVMNLFQDRGWTAVITDRVVGLVLGVGILNGGVGTGLAAIAIERLVTWCFHSENGDSDLPPSYVFGPLMNIPLVSFILGFIIGCVVSGIMMKVIHGAVNTLIVCWAESPDAFAENHKHWADKMTEVWSSAFPGTQDHNGRALSDTTISAETTNSGRYGSTGMNNN